MLIPQVLLTIPRRLKIPYPGYKHSPHTKKALGHQRPNVRPKILLLKRWTYVLRSPASSSTVPEESALPQLASILPSHPAPAPRKPTRPSLTGDLHRTRQALSFPRIRGSGPHPSTTRAFPLLVSA